jgi:NADH-quinone oxidoreductase subunit J
MVLFLFVIMLLDLKEEEQRKIKTTGVVLGLIVVGTIYTIFLRAFASAAATASAATPQLEGGTLPLGRALFTDYLLPFEVLSVLLLVAMVGVVLLSKKDLK